MFPEGHNCVGQGIRDVEWIDTEQRGRAAEFPFAGVERIDRRPFAIEGFQGQAVAPEPFEHGVDKIAKLRFQYFPLDARFPFIDELDPGVRRFVSPPPSLFQYEDESEGRELEGVVGGVGK